ncbi:hypothetical protein SETIT_5G101900v2 [Setaria italica]|uniref:Uncharacterized protein n=1 Tax=Setaria italica TaxID=4555 RepID=A0A368R3K0_SETIT|nr:hypothetical protein SETIT_5G101900v2 [Setaria italica]
MFSSSSGNPAGGGDEAAGRGGIGVLGGIGGAPDGDEDLDVSSQGEDSSRISMEIENLRFQLAMKKKELQYSQENKKLRAELALRAKDMEHLIKENEELKAQNEVLQNKENKKLRADLALKAKDMENLIKENEKLKAENELHFRSCNEHVFHDYRNCPKRRQAASSPEEEDGEDSLY